MVVVGGVAAYILTRPSEEAEEYELSYGYEVGEYYVYETTAGTDSSTYSMQITAVDGDEITVEYVENVENISPSEYGVSIESAEATLSMTMTNKGETISWEIEDVIPPEYWENVEIYENSMMPYGQLFEVLFPEEPVPVGEEWETPIDVGIPWGSATLPMVGQTSVHFVGEENVTVEAGTFACYRLDYSASASGELTDTYTITMDSTSEGTNWYSKQNCAPIKSTGSFNMTWEYDEHTGEHSMEMMSELIESGTV